MALTDPQSITINGVTTSLPRVTSGNYSASYSSADGNIVQRISHVLGRRSRRMIRVDHRKVAADPFTSANVEVSMSCYMVIDVPKSGYSVAEQKQVVDGLIANLTATSGALTTKLLGGES